MLQAKIGDIKYKEIKMKHPKIVFTKDKNGDLTIKKIDKLKTSKTDLKLIKNNLNILRFTQHPNIIKLFDIYEEEKFFYYVLEYYEEVDLFTYIEKRNYK